MKWNQFERKNAWKTIHYKALLLRSLLTILRFVYCFTTGSNASDFHNIVVELLLYLLSGWSRTFLGAFSFPKFMLTVKVTSEACARKASLHGF
jgi:hypothetical protein